MNKLDKEKVQKLAKRAFDSVDAEGEGNLSLEECIKAFKVLMPDK